MKFYKVILLSFICLLLNFKLFSQSYIPTTNWPYLNENFKEGTIYFTDDKKSTLYLNVHLNKSNLHYLKGNRIYNSLPSDVERIRVDNDEYIIINGNQLAKVIAQKDSNFLVSVIRGDYEALSTSTGAYGIDSHTSAASKLSSFSTSGLSNLTYDQMTLEKGGGEILPTKEEKYFLINEELVPAKKRKVLKYLGPRKNELKNYIKANKLKWRRNKDLVEILNFF